MTPDEKRRRFRDLGKTLPVKTARQLEAEQEQLEFDFTPAARQPARRLRPRDAGVPPKDGRRRDALTRYK